MQEYLQVSMVGIMAVKIRNKTAINIQPELLRTLNASLPMPSYMKPIRSPTIMCEINLILVKVWKSIIKSSKSIVEY